MKKPTPPRDIAINALKSACDRQTFGHMTIGWQNAQQIHDYLVYAMDKLGDRPTRHCYEFQDCPSEGCNRLAEYRGPYDKPFCDHHEFQKQQTGEG